MYRIAIIATDPVTADRLMEGQLAYLRTRGFDVTVITAPGPGLKTVAEREGVRTVGVPMRRQIAPLHDFVSLVRLTAALRKLDPDVVSAGTPKGGLLGTLAARLCGVPVVVYHLRGLRFETERGMKRAVLMGAERIASLCAKRVVCNGESLRREFVGLGLAPEEKTWVPAHGTSNGVDVHAYRRSCEAIELARDERKKLGFDATATVIGFVGRLTRDKGVSDLARAFELASKECPELRLLLVGDFDETDPVEPSVATWLRRDRRVVVTGFVRDPSRYYHMMDIFAFPSHREGFPNAPLEAAASGLPVVGARVTGTVDALVNGETGTLVDVSDSEGLARAFVVYGRNPDLRRQHGERGARWVAEHFQRDVVWSALANEYTRLVRSARG